MRRRVNIVPHTHWDREWYLPFQEFRLRLVEVLDDLLPRMEADPSYARFLLDGQLAVIDDYLEVRPAAAEQIRRLVASERLSIGPWYTLPDEFLVSGETLLRDLQLGQRVAARYGGAMTIGYMPDMFGHVAQMPQILSQFGFDQAVVWRGTPSTVDRTGFWWRSPDGSTVHAEYLPEGYGNGAYLPDDAKTLVSQVAEFDYLWSELLGDSPILWMNGTDHQAPKPTLGRVVAEANALQDDYEMVVTSLSEHLAMTSTDDLPVQEGELRSSARANLLMGVTSNRVDIRQAAAGAERSLERLAEPLSALALPAQSWPENLLDEAWLQVVRNAAHDSVCACSVDEVCDAVHHRYAEASQIGTGLARQALDHLGRRIPHTGPVAVNPTARPRAGVVELAWPGEDPPPGTQVVAHRPAEQIVMEGPVSLVVPGSEELNWDRDVEAFTLETAGSDDLEGTILVEADRSGGALITSAVRGELAAVDHAGPVRLRVRQRPSLQLLVPVSEVAGFGWQSIDAASDHTTKVDHPVSAQPTTLTNGLLRVEVEPSTGTWSLDDGTHRAGGLGRLVDGGDCGDTYNWCPPVQDTVIDGPESIDVQVTESGPLRARLRVRTVHRWPARAEGQQRRVGEVPQEVTTQLELRAGEPFVRLEISLDNRCRDHRLRAHFPLPTPAERSRAECAFAVVERPLEAEGGPTELALATYPARRFVQAGGLTVIHDGVAEYELVDLHTGNDGRRTARELALTVLRSSGMLSQRPMATRPLPAGPLTPLEGSQLQRPVVSRHAVALGDVDPYALADKVLVPLQLTEGAGDRQSDPLPSDGSLLAVEGAEVTAVLRRGGGLRVRVVNPTELETTVSFPGRQGWLVDLADRPLEPFEGHFTLRPWGIATAALNER